MRVSFSPPAKQSLGVVLLLVACGGVSHRDGADNGDSGGSGARNGSGSGGDGSVGSGSVGSGPIPAAGGYGNTAGRYSDVGGGSWATAGNGGGGYIDSGGFGPGGEAGSAGYGGEAGDGYGGVPGLEGGYGGDLIAAGAPGE